MVEAVSPIEHELTVNVEGRISTPPHQGERRAVFIGHVHAMFAEICVSFVSGVTIPTFLGDVRVAPGK